MNVHLKESILRILIKIWEEEDNSSVHTGDFLNKSNQIY